jgi:hypothetical protein
MSQQGQSNREQRKREFREEILGNSKADLTKWAGELRATIAGGQLSLPRRQDYELELEVIEARLTELS